ncbi:MAG: alpha/beta hydrolase [Armatimonadota bacterium]
MQLLAALAFTLQDSAIKERIVDHIYHKQGGAAFSYDVFKPNKPNGVAVIWMVSGGWVSDHNNISVPMAELACAKGVTLFQVVHGAQPRYKMGEILDQVHRAVKDIRANAKQWGVNPNKFGVSGASAGGHLSLMIGTQGCVPVGSDVLLKTSSEVQSIAVLFPPTDFLNYGKEGGAAFKNPLLVGAYGATFGVDTKSPEDKLSAIGKLYSPATYVSEKTPPTLLIHGDKDLLVPIQQSEWFKSKLDGLKIKNNLIVVPGEGHGFKDMVTPFNQILDWHLQTLK